MHYHKIKMTAAAMAMAVLVTGNMPAAELNTATVSAKSAISAVLPAAGVGLVLNDGVSVSQIREEIKKRKEKRPFLVEFCEKTIPSATRKKRFQCLGCPSAHCIEQKF